MQSLFWTAFDKWSQLTYTKWDEASWPLMLMMMLLRMLRISATVLRLHRWETGERERERERESTKCEDGWRAVNYRWNRMDWTVYIGESTWLCKRAAVRWGRWERNEGNNRCLWFVLLLLFAASAIVPSPHRCLRGVLFPSCRWVASVSVFAFIPSLYCFASFVRSACIFLPASLDIGRRRLAHSHRRD